MFFYPLGYHMRNKELDITGRALFQTSDLQLLLNNIPPLGIPHPCFISPADPGDESHPWNLTPSLPRSPPSPGLSWTDRAPLALGVHSGAKSSPGTEPQLQCAVPRSYPLAANPAGISLRVGASD